MRATLKAREAADYIGLSYWKLLELAKAGEVPHARVGGRVLFRRESLDAWLDLCERKSVHHETGTTRGKIRVIGR